MNGAQATGQRVAGSLEAAGSRLAIQGGGWNRRFPGNADSAVQSLRQEDHSLFPTGNRASGNIYT